MSKKPDPKSIILDLDLNRPRKMFQIGPDSDSQKGPELTGGMSPQGADSPLQGKAGKNHLNEEFTPLLPNGIGEQYSQTISNLGHAAL